MKKLKITFNSPVILGFAFISFSVLVLGSSIVDLDAHVELVESSLL